MDVEKLLKEFNIPYVTPGEHHHCTRGWINIHCPFCTGSQNFHLGIAEDGESAHCWRCGGHSIIATLSRVLGLPNTEVKKVLKRYRGKSTSKIKHKEAQVAINPFKFPSPNSELKSKPYKEYLHNRGFDPVKLKRIWSLGETGPVSYLDRIDYSNRILIPIHWDGEAVSFQARDMTGQARMKYMACPKKREKIHHKNILYGRQDLWEELDTLIIVEGVVDVWRLGHHAVATFGIEFTTQQILKLYKYPTRFFIVYDTGSQAQMQARKLATKLKALGKQAYVETISEGDPGDMEQADADYFVKQLVKKP